MMIHVQTGDFATEGSPEPSAPKLRKGVSMFQKPHFNTLLQVKFTPKTSLVPQTTKNKDIIKTNFRFPN